jgi:hypothetical protein
MDSGAKIRIKVGSMEVEYEGEPSFLKDGLESLLAKMADLSTQVPAEPELNHYRLTPVGLRLECNSRY